MRETVGKESSGVPVILWVAMPLLDNCTLDWFAASGTLFGR